MVRNIVQIGSRELTQISKPLRLAEIKDSATASLAHDLIDTVNHYSQEAAGLSAVQISVLKRIYVVRRFDLESSKAKKKEGKPLWEVMINPELEIIDSNLNTEWEGCLSIGKGSDKLFAPVSRPRQIRVSYYNTHGKKKELIATDFFSSLIQHEQDHLNGILFLSYVKNPRNIWKESDLDLYITKNRSFPEILTN